MFNVLTRLVNFRQNHNVNILLSDKIPQSICFCFIFQVEIGNAEHLSIFISINKADLCRLISPLCKKCSVQD